MASFSIDDQECHRIVAIRFGDAIAASICAFRIDRVPLTEQGKPERTAIKQLATRSPLAA